MEREPDERPVAPGERVERTEVIERTPSLTRTPAPAAAPMWVWVLPLVIIAILLAWFAFTRGEPSTVFEGAPDVEIESRDIEISAPEVEAPAIEIVPAEPAESPPADPAPAPAETPPQ